MPAVRPDSSLKGDFDVCGACGRPRSDPRVLPCKHDFCLPCLEKLLNDDQQSVLTIACPKCQIICEFDDGDRPCDLPILKTGKPVTKDNENLIPRNSLDEPLETGIGTGSCKGVCKDGPAGYCLHCNKAVCHTCLLHHQNDSVWIGHEVLLRPDNHCESRGRSAEETRHHKAATLFCFDCKQVICHRCALDEHDDHVIKNEADVADEKREALRALIIEHFGSEYDEPEDATKQDILLDNMRMRHHRLDVEVSDLIRELRQCKIRVLDLEDQITRRDAARFARYLAEDAEDREVIARADLFPVRLESASTVPPSVPPSPVTAPISPAFKLGIPFTTPSGTSYISRKFSRGQTLEDIVEDETEPQIRERMCFKVGGGCCGLSWDEGNHELVVRSGHPRDPPIRVFNMSGRQVRVCGGQVDGLSGLYPSGIAVDTSRQVYMACRTDGTVSIIDREGRKLKPIKNLGAGSLHHIVYGTKSDLVALADWDKSQVIMYDPRKSGVLGRINLAHRRPFSVSWRSQGLLPTLIIADWGGDIITEYTVKGQIIRTYPPSLSGLDINPYGVCTDNMDHVIACDHDNQRLVGCGSDDSSWECLASANQLQGYPLYIAHNSEDNVLAVCMRSGIVKIFDTANYQ